MATPLRPEIRAAIEEGLSRFQAGRWWDAHEAWEDAWLVEEGIVRLGLQALIQMTAAFHKGLKMNSPSGMVKLLDASLDKLGRIAKLDPTFADIDIMTLGQSLAGVRMTALQWSRNETGPESIRIPILSRSAAAPSEGPDGA